MQNAFCCEDICIYYAKIMLLIILNKIRVLFHVFNPHLTKYGKDLAASYLCSRVLYLFLSFYSVAGDESRL